MRLALVLLALAASCTKHNPASCADDGVCTDPSLPFCDVNGAAAGVPGVCIAPSCTANQFVACDGAAALICNSSGDGYETTTCADGCSPENGCNGCVPGGLGCDGSSLASCDAEGTVSATTDCALGCATTPAAHCKTLAPRYLPDVCATPSAVDLMVAANGTLDTDLDASCTGGIIEQTGGPALCVIHARTIDVTQSVTLKLIASSAASKIKSGRAVALVADMDLTIAGIVDASASQNQSGPGGGYVQSGGAATPTTAFGGAGFHTNGGAGGSDSMSGGAGNGGTAMPDPAALTIFEGGPYGNGIGGGGGGGALMLISCAGAVRVTGQVVAGGGGGLGAVHLTGPVGGAGGGAGGYIVVQGAAIEITGGVFANGGGGGAGAVAGPGSTTQYGANGNGSTSQASGGTPQAGAGSGGLGGALTGPGPGGAPTINGDTPGGGGGSVGFIQTYTPAGVAPNIGSAHVSPGFQPNANIPTR